MSQGTLVAIITSPSRVPPLNPRFDLAKQPLLVNTTFFALPILLSSAIITVAAISQYHFNHALAQFAQLQKLLAAASIAYGKGRQLSVFPFLHFNSTTVIFSLAQMADLNLCIQAKTLNYPP
jgi:hypothetical protein